VYFLKVAIVDSYFSVVDVELQKALNLAGLDTYVITSNLRHYQYKKTTMQFDNEFNKQIQLKTHEFPIAGLNLYFPFPITPDLTKTIKQMEFDVVQTTEHVSTPSFWCNFRKENWKTVLIERGGEWKGIVSKFGIHDLLAKKFILPKVDLFASLSSHAAEYLRFLGCTKNITNIPNPIDIKFFSLVTPWNERKNVILFVGRLTKLRYLDTLILAMPIVRRKIPDSELWIMGDGNDRDYFFNLAAGKEYIKFLGSKKRSELPLYYNQAKVNVTLSDRRLAGIGLATEEAMACGVPIVGSETLPFDESKKLFYFACKPQPESIADNIIRCTLEGEQYSRMARVVAENTYSYKAVGDSYKKMISSLQ